MASREGLRPEWAETAQRLRAKPESPARRARQTQRGPPVGEPQHFANSMKAAATRCRNSASCGNSIAFSMTSWASANASTARMN